MLINRGVAALAAGLFFAAGASADPVLVSCADEDVIHVSWDSKLSVSYAGGPNGDISVKSDHIDFTVSARLSERSAEIDGATVKIVEIYGSAEIDALMPNAADLLACAERTIQPEFKDDADMQAMAVMSCAPQAKPSTARISASVKLGLFPAEAGSSDDMIVEIKRRYLDVKTPAGQDVVIESFPKDCRLASQ